METANEPLLSDAPGIKIWCSRFPRWRHCLVTAILFVAVVLHASTGQPPFLRKGRSPLFLWAAPSKDVPTLRIHGGPEPPSRMLDWVPRVCTDRYEGPRCSNVTLWNGIVTLEIEGRIIPNVKMHTRGHSSAMFPKHQFGLRLPKAIPVLGMTPARTWVLATSFVDASFQRNPVAFDIYRHLGGWATETEYVNVDWHGQDYGLYYVGQRIKCGQGRLDVCHRDKDPAASGFLLTIDWAKPGDVAIQSNVTSTFFNVLYPKGALTSQEHSFLVRLINEVDLQAAGLSKHDYFSKIVDFPSFIRYFILEELAKDVDGYAFSNYVKIKNGVLFHAAPWDFDLAFNFACMPRYFTNALTGEAETGVRGWNVENSRSDALWIGPMGFPGGSVQEFGMNKRQLFLNIWKYPGFKVAFATAWREARQRALGDEALVSMVAHRSRVIATSAERDLYIWRHTNRCAFWNCCAPQDAQSFEEAQEHLTSYLLARARWIDANVDLLN